MRAYEFITEAELPGVMGQAEKTKQSLDLFKDTSAAYNKQKEAERQQDNAWKKDPAAYQVKSREQALQADPVSQMFTPGVSTAQDVGDVAQGDLGAAPFAALGMAPVVGGPLSKFAKKVFGRERKATQAAADVSKVPVTPTPTADVSRVPVANKTPNVWRKNEQPPADRLVRVQPSIDNLIVNKDGTVSIDHRASNAKRNTSHWTQNSVVGSHEMGNWDADAYAIIADPTHIKAPMVGAKPEDTFYTLDKSRKLNIGRPTILAPKGAPVPKGMNVLHYDDTGGMTARNAAVQQTLQSQGAPYRGATKKFGYDPNIVDPADYEKIGQSFADKYGNKGPATSPGGWERQHDATIHSDAESTAGILQGVVDRTKARVGRENKTRNYLAPRDDGVLVPIWELPHIDNRSINFKKKLADYFEKHPETAEYERNYWAQQLGSINRSEKEIEKLKSAHYRQTGAEAEQQKSRELDAALAAERAKLAPPPPPAPVLAISKPGAK
jgi:hypothetical protein